MLASAETIKVVAECLREFGVKTTVIDPVWIEIFRTFAYETILMRKGYGIHFWLTAVTARSSA